MSNEAKKIETVFPREAAALALEKMLDVKAKGDHITAREVVEATAFTVDQLRGRIKTWAKRKGFVIEPVPNDGYRILLDIEHADRARRKAATGARIDKEVLRGLIVTDTTKLDDAQARRHEFLLPRAAARAARSEQDSKETRQEFRLTERVPLRVLAKPKDE